MDPRALAVATSLLCGASALLLGTANLMWPSYGLPLLQLLASLLPGYAGQPSPGAVAVLTAYASVDGAIFGYALGWLYRRARR